MLRNDIEIDVKVKCIEEGKTQAKIAESIGTSAQYVSRLINHQDKILNKTYISIMEELGYDIEEKVRSRQEQVRPQRNGLSRQRS